MTDIENGSSGAPGDASGDNQENGSKGSVAYETYRKSVAAEKAAKAKLNDLLAKEAEREQTALQEQGKYKEALESAQKKLKEMESSLDITKKTYAKNLFIREAKQIAMQMGAMPEALDDLVKVADWSGVEIDEQYNINSQQLKDRVGAIAKEKPFYFKKTAALPKDVSTSGGASGGFGKSKDEMSSDEIIKMLHALEQK